MSTLVCCLPAWEGAGMGSGALALDTIVSAAFFFVGKWTPELKRSQSRDVLRLLIYKLYEAGRGDLFQAQVQVSQAELAAKCELSLRWCHELVGRLKESGWIRAYSVRISAEMNAPCVFSPGPHLKRLLFKLLKSRWPKRPAKSATHPPSYSVPPSGGEKKRGYRPPTFRTDFYGKQAGDFSHITNPVLQQLLTLWHTRGAGPHGSTAHAG